MTAWIVLQQTKNWWIIYTDYSCFFVFVFRDLKNKETCIDLAVVSYKEFPASFMRSTYEFQIVVVSSLSCFKLPSHKESDVVQFTVSPQKNFMCNTLWDKDLQYFVHSN